MTFKRLLILGASGHGRVVADCARAQGAWSEILFFDDRWPKLTQNATWAVAGGSDQIVGAARSDDELFVAIGHSATRVRFLNAFMHAGARLATIIHPNASVSVGASIGAGSIVVAGAVVNIGASIDVGCIVNTGASVDHDCKLGAGVHVCPGGRLAGDVKVGAGSWVGIGAAVKQGVTIGENVTIGAGAAVVHDVEGHQTVVGVPARPIKKQHVI